MITELDYYRGRNVSNADELTDEIRANAIETIRRANLLLGMFCSEYRDFRIEVMSGWRPLAVNLNTPGASRNSKHLTARAVDIRDDDGLLDDWCMSHLQQLENIGLWLEHPASTKNWCHVQTVAPASGNRWFYP